MIKRYIQNKALATILFIVACMALAIWYLYDAFLVSATVENLILIAPISATVLLLCSIELIKSILAYKKHLQNMQTQSDSGVTFKVVVGILLFIVFSILGSIIGYDIVATIYMCLMLLLQGERNWIILIGYPIGFSIFIFWLFSTLLPYPIPSIFDYIIN